MNKITTTILFVLSFLSMAYAQKTDLNDQDLTVIKSYQYDVAQTTPLKLEIDYKLTEAQIVSDKISVDLLPVKLEEVTYSIQPIAHQPDPANYNKGYAKASIGTMNNLGLDVSFRHQAPNYFLYGLDLNFIHLKDKTILNKSIFNRSASAFVKYYMRPTFWMEYDFELGLNDFGVFGFNDKETAISTAQERIEQYRVTRHNVNLFKRFKQVDIDILNENDLISTAHPQQREKEQLFSHETSITKGFKSPLEIALSTVYEGQISTINGTETALVWNNRFQLSWTKPHIGFNLGGLYSKAETQRILPNGLFYFAKKDHKLELHYSNDISLNSFSSSQNEVILINRLDYQSSIAEKHSYGLKYTYSVTGNHHFAIHAHDINLVNDQIWVNDIDDVQLFKPELYDYSYYDLGVSYEIFFAQTMSITQRATYRHLKDESLSALPNFQKFQISNELKFQKNKMRLSAEYIFGDKIAYGEDLADYSSASFYQHNVTLSLRYDVSEKFNIEIKGIDLLDNRFESFAGYRDFGRRAELSIKTIF